MGRNLQGTPTGAAECRHGPNTPETCTSEHPAARRPVMVGSLTQLAANVQPEPPCTVSEPSAAESSPWRRGNDANEQRRVRVEEKLQTAARAHLQWPWRKHGNFTIQQCYMAAPGAGTYPSSPHVCQLKQRRKQRLMTTVPSRAGYSVLRNGTLDRGPWARTGWWTKAKDRLRPFKARAWRVNIERKNEPTLYGVILSPPSLAFGGSLQLGPKGSIRAEPLGGYGVCGNCSTGAQEPPRNIPQKPDASSTAPRPTTLCMERWGLLPRCNGPIMSKAPAFCARSQKRLRSYWLRNALPAAGHDRQDPRPGVGHPEVVLANDEAAGIAAQVQSGLCRRVVTRECSSSATAGLSLPIAGMDAARVARGLLQARRTHYIYRFSPTDSRLPTRLLAYLVFLESAAWPPGRYAVGQKARDPAWPFSDYIRVAVLEDCHSGTLGATCGGEQGAPLTTDADGPCLD
ncbi:hypothetical protein ACCO45_002460 [Purpureocillium lilacinum]|uniref:Uncharacterized protein n=1 Tax=Purpureocillium lilacinum TaxID=33203 RepID=A0ACC4EC35_PURLI